MQNAPGGCHIIVHVPSGTLRTWKWSPTPRSVILDKLFKYKEKWFGEKTQNQDSISVYYDFSFFTKDEDDPRVDTHIPV